MLKFNFRFKEFQIMNISSLNPFTVEHNGNDDISMYLYVHTFINARCPTSCIIATRIKNTQEGDLKKILRFI